MGLSSESFSMFMHVEPLALIAYRILLKPLSRAKPTDCIELAALRYAAVVFAYDGPG